MAARSSSRSRLVGRALTAAAGGGLAGALVLGRRHRRAGQTGA